MLIHEYNQKKTATFGKYDKFAIICFVHESTLLRESIIILSSHFLVSISGYCFNKNRLKFFVVFISLYVNNL